MSVLPKRLFHWSTLFAKLNLIKNERYEKVLFSDIGHRPLRHGCAGAKFIRRSYRPRTTPCGPERRGVERGGIPWFRGCKAGCTANDCAYTGLAIYRRRRTTAISSGSDSRTPSLSGAETIFSFRHWQFWNVSYACRETKERYSPDCESPLRITLSWMDAPGRADFTWRGDRLCRLSCQSGWPYRYNIGIRRTIYTSLWVELCDSAGRTVEAA